MPKFIDITGQKFGLLTVMKRSDYVGNGKKPIVYYDCLCDCGTTQEFRGLTYEADTQRAVDAKKSSMDIHIKNDCTKHSVTLKQGAKTKTDRIMNAMAEEGLLFARNGKMIIYLSECGH